MDPITNLTINPCLSPSSTPSPRFQIDPISKSITNSTINACPSPRPRKLTNSERMAIPTTTTTITTTKGTKSSDAGIKDSYTSVGRKSSDVQSSDLAPKSNDAKTSDSHTSLGPNSTNAKTGDSHAILGQKSNDAMASDSRTSLSPKSSDAKTTDSHTSLGSKSTNAKTGDSHTSISRKSSDAMISDSRSSLGPKVSDAKTSDSHASADPKSREAKTSDSRTSLGSKSSDAKPTDFHTSLGPKFSDAKTSDSRASLGPKLSDAKTSDSYTSTDPKSRDVKTSDSRTSVVQGRCSDSLDNSMSAPLKPHTGGDGRWEAIQLANSRDSPLGLSHFRLLKRLGYGDIGSVYLVELRGTNAFFAMKVMDKASLASRNKLIRAQTEREILGLLDHPFLPTLYSHFDTDKFYCLVMEFCSGGNLHSLRQKQPNKYFSEQAARFYASEVLLALEYLHMLGIVYRDLKPENVLVREEGHIMLSDFDLSLRCSVSPTLVKSTSAHVGSGYGSQYSILENDFANLPHGCIQPSSFFPRILPKKNRKTKSDFGVSSGGSLPELMAEPTSVRSMSFVGTHEYLAPEIIRGEGHGSAVDWWTFGIFLYELLHGTTPFKGSGNRATLYNVVGQPLRFPETPAVSLVARDLIRGLLVKDPQRRIAYRRGATEIKQHPFFEGVNWALVRSAIPPHIPEPVDLGQYASKEVLHLENKVVGLQNGAAAAAANKTNSNDYSHLDFEYF